MLSPLLKSLGISSDKKLRVKNSDLAQGLAYINYNDLTRSRVLNRLPFLQVSSIPGLFSINEAMNDKNSINKNDTIISHNQNTTTDIINNENAFNKSLSEYANLQQILESNNLYQKVDASVTATILSKLSDLNLQLTQHAKRINADMSKLDVSDMDLKKHISKQQTDLNNYIHNLDEQRELMDTVDGMDESTTLTRKSNQYYYLMWIIVLITILSLSIYILTSDLVINTIVVIIALIVIYLLSRAISRQ